jgi:hypothetical protein
MFLQLFPRGPGWQTICACSSESQKTELPPEAVLAGAGVAEELCYRFFGVTACVAALVSLCRFAQSRIVDRAFRIGKPYSRHGFAMKRFPAAFKAKSGRHADLDVCVPLGFLDYSNQLGRRFSHFTEPQPVPQWRTGLNRP